LNPPVDSHALAVASVIRVSMKPGATAFTLMRTAQLDGQRARHALEAGLRGRVVGLARLPCADVDERKTIFP